MNSNEAEKLRKEELRIKKAQRRKERWAARTPEQIEKDKAIANKWSRECRKKRVLTPEQKQKQLDYNNARYNKNKEEMSRRQREAYANNIEKLRSDKRRRLANRTNEQKQKDKERYQQNRKEVLNINKQWRSENKEYLREYRRSRSSPLRQLKNNIRCAIHRSFKLIKLKKNNRTEKILGCSFQDFKTYIESKFEPWMTWDNHGLYNGTAGHGWDLDHIMPMSSAQNSEDVILLNHYTNFQPLCSFINRHVKRDDPNYLHQTP